MKYILFALILSISLHLLTFKTFKINIKENVQNNSSNSKTVSKSNINFVQLKKAAPKVVEEVKPIKEPKKIEKKIEKPIKKETTKKIVKKKKTYKKVEKKALVKTKKRETIKKVPIKTEAKPTKTEEVIPNYTKLNPTKLQKNTLEDMLMNSVSEDELIDELTKSYIKLYGDEYNSFTKVQKVFLQKNLKTIGSVTQKYLRYPAISVRTKQSGTNIIEFILHPNGDITKPMITTSSGYTALDKNTIETVEIAYKDYPRPKEPTKIRIYVTYRLY